MHRVLVLVAALSPLLARAQTEELENPGSVSAVQERAFRMQHELDLVLGVLPLDAFYKGLYGQVAYTFHFTDSFAWQVGRAGWVYAAKTGLREQLERDFNVVPTTFEEVQYFAGSDLMWKPIYFKLAWLNRAVVHGELWLLLGGTAFKFTNGFRPGVNVGGGLRLFGTKNVSFRLDLTDTVVMPTGVGSSVLNVMTLTAGLAINFGATE